MASDLECVVWCPKCRVPKYEIRRVPTGKEGVYEHASIPPGRNEKACECGAILERKS